jgi:hypothetical protein
MLATLLLASPACERSSVPPGQERSLAEIVPQVLVGKSALDHETGKLIVLDPGSLSRPPVRHLVEIEGRPRIQDVDWCGGSLFISQRGHESKAGERREGGVFPVDLATMTLGRRIPVPFERNYVGALAANDEALFALSDNGVFRITLGTGAVTPLWVGEISEFTNLAATADCVAFTTSKTVVKVIDAGTGTEVLTRDFEEYVVFAGTAANHLLLRSKWNWSVVPLVDDADPKDGEAIERLARVDRQVPASLVEAGGVPVLLRQYELPVYLQIVADVRSGDYAVVRMNKMQAGLQPAPEAASVELLRRAQEQQAQRRQGESRVGG